MDAPTPAPPRTRVLVVDDNPDGLFITMKLLASAGFDVTTAPDGVQAFESARQTPPDLILSDVVMPGMDGRELCRRVKAHPALAHVLVALISGIETLPENVAEGLECGADEYLTRPIVTRELFARLRSLERLHRARAAMADAVRHEQEANALLDQLHSSSPFGLAFYDPDCRYLRINDNLARMNGRPVPAHRGKSVHEVIPHLALEISSRISDVLATGSIVSKQDTTGSGEPGDPRRHWQVTYYPVPSSPPFRGVGAIVMDVTSHKQAEDAVRELNQQLEGRVVERTAELLRTNADLRAEIAHRRQAEQALARQASRLRVLNNLSRKLAAQLSVREMCGTVAECLAKEFGFFHVAVFTLQPGASELVMEGMAGGYTSLISPGHHRQPAGKGIIGRAARTGRRCVVPDVGKCPAFFQLEGMRIRSEAAVPIRVKRRTVGVLNVDSERLNAFEPGDVNLLETVAGQLAAAFERARLFNALEAELTERRRAEQEMRRVANSISDYLWSIEVDRRHRDVRRYYSPVVEKLTGRPPAFFEGSVQNWLSTIHPEDRPRLAKASRQLRAGRLLRLEDEYRIIRPDGSVRWIRNSAVVHRLANGHLRLDGVGADITLRKEAEKALHELPSRILGAQESERRRIAGELHDSVSQILSTAKFRLHSTESSIPAPVAKQHPQLRRGRELVEVALREVRRITRNLRPSELDDLGLLPAVRTLLDEFKDSSRMTVIFKATRIPAQLPGDFGLAIYRIIQEGLANIWKHARATRVLVRITRTGKSLRLSLADDGRGFNPKRPGPRNARGSGLGLAHMRERTVAIGGTFSIESSRGRGTRILAIWPSVPREPAHPTN